MKPVHHNSRTHILEPMRPRIAAPKARPLENLCSETRENSAMTSSLTITRVCSLLQLEKARVATKTQRSQK